MELLLEKIKASTKDGSPSVSQLIELQEMARTLKVPKSQLDKLIAQAIETNKETEPTKKEEYSRKDYDSQRTDYSSSRNSFEEEMNKRRQESNLSFEREEIVFDQPEVTFDPIEVNFDNPIEEKEDTITPPEPIKEEVVIDPPETIENFTQQVVEEVEQEVENFQQGTIDQSELEETIRDLSEETEQFQQEIENPREELEYIVGEEETYEEEEQDIGLDDHDGFLSDFIKHREQELKKEVHQEEEYEEEVEQETSYESHSSYEPQPSRESIYNNSNSKAAFKEDLEDDQKIFLMGIGSIILPFIFGTLGGILGIVTLSQVAKAEQVYSLAPNHYHDDSIKKIKSGKTMAVIGVVIASLRLLATISSYLIVGF